MKSVLTFFLLLVLLLGFSSKANSQEFPLPPDSLQLEVSAEIDSLWLEFLETNSLIYNYFSTEQDSIVKSLPQTSEQFQAGFAELNALTPLNLEYTSFLDPYVKEYLLYPHQLSKLQGLKKLYFPMMEEVLDRKDMPIELKNLSLIESGLNPNARSPQGATGLWQFMLPTGKECGLMINSYIDERKDPIKSTEAACYYLGRLFNIYEVWELAIAAYNCGPGNVNKAIKLSGGSKNFWKIRPFLPRETQKYVPRFMAMCYLMEYSHLHGIVTMEPDFNYWRADTVMVNSELRFDQIVNNTSITFDDLTYLNPHYKAGIIPKSKEGRLLFIPTVKSESYHDNKSKFYTFKPKEKAKFVAQVDPPRAKNTSYKSKPKSYYKVRSGDVLGTIAERHGVSVSQIKRWNGIRGTRIKAGQKLVLYGANVSPKSSSKTTTTAPKLESGYEYYTVRRGDTLWDIAKLYKGVSADDIKRLNKGVNAKNLKAGTKLKIKRSI